ncbi:MAG: DUF4392 domain-containing protein [Planctomycetia bacterium]|nr:DUF4392 domain-containing protein [Planctomycetia bacterium]
MMRDATIDWRRLDGLVRRDPSARGLAAYRDAEGRPIPSDLAAAAHDLQHATKVLLVTGFGIATSAGLRAETDGPPGAVFLASMLRACAIDVDIATDELGAPLVRAGLRAADLADVGLIEVSASFSYDDCDGILSDGYSHLVAIERVGPNHTQESIARQDARAADDFERLVAPEDRDTCRNMRGESIDDRTPPLHLLFEQETDDEDDPSSEVSRPVTIGIADGGNEIGCGRIAWSTLRKAVAQGPAELIACRIATDYLIIAGISNWGAYALGAAVAVLCERQAEVRDWSRDRQRAILVAMVEEAGAVDGMTKRAEPTVDGVALAPYLDTFDKIRSLF